MHFFLNSYDFYSDPRPTNMKANRGARNDANLNIQNLNMLLKHIKSYYEEVQKQVIVMSLPKVLMMVHNFRTQEGLAEMQKLLLLVLGCAVQCDQRERFVEKMKQLTYEGMETMMNHIKDVTENTDKVLNLQWEELVEIPADDLEELTRKMSLHIRSLVSERDKQAMNSSLVTEARSTRALRDENDILKERAGKASKLEFEIEILREKVKDVDFYKQRVEELRDDNKILHETKALVEEQLKKQEPDWMACWTSEKRIVDLNRKLQAMTQEHENDQRRIQSLSEKVSNLEFDKMQSMNESGNLAYQLEQARGNIDSGRMSILDESEESTLNRALRLEKENKRLQALMAKYQDATKTHEITQASMLELEKENQRLKRRVQEMEQENNHLVKTIESLRERAKIGANEKVKAIEKENKVLSELVQDMTTKHHKLEYETKRLNEKIHDMEDSIHLAKEVQKDNSKLEKQNHLEKTVKQLELTCRKMETIEQSASDLEVENRQLKVQVENLKNLTQQLQQLEDDKTSSDMEITRLKRQIESLKKTCDRVANLEQDKLEAEKSAKRFQQALESMKASMRQSEKMEVVQMELESQLERVRSQLEVQKERLIVREREINEIEVENEEILSAETEELRVTVTRLNETELREDLVTEKLTSHQRLTQLESLNTELQKIGLSRDELQQLNNDSDNDKRFRALESKLDSTLKRSLEAKEEKIESLEARLKESVNLNNKLRSDIKTLKHDYESLSQRHQEEVVSVGKLPKDSRRVTGSVGGGGGGGGGEIFKIKDHLISVERKVIFNFFF
uniref:HOOK N-terminal domain-containing protein n=1 Tax=Ciona savignyi TaxID=51511 RepID=H2ZQJ0_CIOSA